MGFLVTGGSGLLGNNIVRMLLEQGESVRVLTRKTTDPRPLAGLDVDARLGDLRDAESIVNAMSGVRHVIHAAADVHIGWRNLDRQRLVNVEGTRHVARAARKNGARMVHVSSVDALAAGGREEAVDELTPDQCKVPCTYVLTKRESESVVREEINRGLDACIVNPGFMLGPWDWKPSSGRMLLGVIKHWIPAAPAGGMSVCDVRDVAHGVLNAIRDGVAGRQYILAGENVTYLRALRMFAKITGRPGPLLPMGPLVRWSVGACGDLKTSLTGHEGDVNSALIRMSSMMHYYRSDRAKKELDYRSRPMEETVRCAWDWFKEYKYV